MKNVVVTGVSTGIGKSIATDLARNGWRVFGSVRKNEDACALQEELGEAFVPLLFDVEDDEAVTSASAQVRKWLGGQTLSALVNNAGIAMAGPLLVQPISDFRKQLEVNLIGVFAVTRAFAPLLGADPDLVGPKGCIINIGSTSGKIALPFLGAYAAAKHGLEGLSQSLRRELRLAGIPVVVVAPGTVVTPIYDKSESSVRMDSIAGTVWERPFERFMAFARSEKQRGLTPEQIGQVVTHVLTVARPRARYAPVAGKFLNWTLPTLLPNRVLDLFICGRFGLERENQTDG